MRIAHLSDVHMLDVLTARSTTRYRLGVKAVSLGRTIDPEGRARKLARGLQAAKAAGANHVVISGDLTELGEPREFEHFAHVLSDAHIANENITLVPGNHDAYTSRDSWKSAMTGPLAAWSTTSAGEPGRMVDRGHVVFLPIDTSCYQSIARSGGAFSHDAADIVERRAADPGLRDKAVVLVLHHPPITSDKNPLWQWIDGLRGRSRIVDLLMKHTHVQLLHGHMHKVVDRVLGLGKARARIFGAPAIVDDHDAPRVRLYDIKDGALESTGMFAM